MTSLRGRTAAAFAVLSAVIACVMGVVVYRTSVDQRSSRLRALALSQARAAAVIYGSTGALVDGATLSDPSAPRGLRRAVDAGRDGTQLVDARGTLTAWGGVPVSNVEDAGVFVNRSGEEDARALAALRRTLLLTALAITVGGALAGTLVADRLSRRLRAAARAANAIAAGDLRARVRAGGPDEVGVLSDAVDAMADALGARIDRERRFNADVAHDLRTPVTGLIAAASLLPHDEVSAMIRERSARLHHLVEDLLEIARLESGEEVADLRPLALRPFLEEIAGRYEAVAVAGAGTVETDPRRLERIVVNLLENASAHGAPPVTVTATDRAVSVSDRGPGFPEGDAILTRHVTHAERGNGLGLAIAAEQARVIGARLTLHNAEDGGAVATVDWSAP